jgi:hypothetical protein
VPARLHGTTSNLRIHIVDWYPTFCNLAGVSPHDDSPVPPLPVDPSNPTKDIYGNNSYPGLDGVDVWGLLTSTTNVSDWAAHPTLAVTSQVYLDHEYTLVIGQGSVADSGASLCCCCCCCIRSVAFLLILLFLLILPFLPLFCLRLRRDSGDSGDTCSALDR